MNPTNTAGEMLSPMHPATPSWTHVEPHTQERQLQTRPLGVWEVHLREWLTDSYASYKTQPGVPFIWGGGI